MATVILKVKIKSKNEETLPDYGLGKGILGTQEVDIPDSTDKYVLAAFLYDIGKELIEQLVEIKIEEKENGTK